MREVTDEMVEAAIKAADWPMYAPYIEKTKRALRAALAVMPSEVPAGMVLVPREASPKIIGAIASQLDRPNVFMGGPSPGAKIRAADIYTAMLAAGGDDADV